MALQSVAFEEAPAPAQEYEFHEAANLFPLLGEKELNDLASDIKENGLQHDIILLDGKILDGRNRYLACLQARIDPRFKQFEGDDPFKLVWSWNGERRHFKNHEQKYGAHKRCMEHSQKWQETKARIREEANKKRAEAAEQGKVGRAAAKAKENDEFSPGTDCAGTKRNYKEEEERRSREVKAKDAGVNRGAVERFEKLDKHRPDLAQQVIDGKLTATQALREMKKEEISKQVNLPDAKYRVIYADPPWSYGNTQPDYHTEQRDHYPVMSLKDICAMDIESICEDNAVLFLWVTSPILEESFQVVKAWGFKYKASFIWDKVKHNMGHYNSVRHEFLLICVKGSCQPDVQKLFDSVVSQERTSHSKKPEVFYEIIETIYPHGKRIELFSRNERKGWDAYGHEAETCAA